MSSVTEMLYRSLLVQAQRELRHDVKCPASEYGYDVVSLIGQRTPEDLAADCLHCRITLALTKNAARW